MVPENTTSALSRGEIQDMRRAEMKAAVQQHLQSLLVVAGQLRQKINESKTDYKKKYYSKKMSKVNGEVMSMIAALQRFEAQHAAVHEPTPEYTVDNAPQTDETITPAG